MGGSSSSSGLRVLQTAAVCEYCKATASACARHRGAAAPESRGHRSVQGMHSSKQQQASLACASRPAWGGAFHLQQVRPQLLPPAAALLIPGTSTPAACCCLSHLGLRLG